MSEASFVLCIHSDSVSANPEKYDCAAMLHAMYKNFCILRGWEVEVRSTPLTFFLSVFGADLSLFKNEGGYHRIVRQSPHDPARRRHHNLIFVEKLTDSLDVRAATHAFNAEASSFDDPAFRPQDRLVRSYVLFPYERVYNHYSSDIHECVALDSVRDVLRGGETLSALLRG